ncbi:hypothetical protein SPRG_04280 [Saprolegnia parasitica CBS 223.65]|uniref:Uncharacterized protein n=1 Tax=Saprolegnia parasitica (strain CBS 223.65) TaxID=695850 RepID=A0A067CWI2_SAPPC|nr:hypothetical protein SPRG_04280 [Saprolegnia parasitica CBS 223.65]KDO31142.1 hypothetical protein SPRG_04280 [Saprolegnia parasitica CBS 223.65]|eukprot:XP_012198270.1 hypothetical protein SPRG_04280 [Saprolegnia parasitica CBS 223.65]
MAQQNENEVLQHLQSPDALPAGDLLALDESGDSVLSLAALRGNLPLVQAIVQSASPDTLAEVAWTTLQRAVANPHQSVVEYLWDILPDAATLKSPSTGNSLLHEAVEGGNLQLLRWLVPRCTDTLDVSNHAGETPYLTALRHVDYASADLLVAAGASTHVCTMTGDSALHYVLRFPPNENTLVTAVERLLADDVRVDATNHAGERPLDLTSNPRILELLHTEVAFRTEFPLHCLVRSKNLDRLDAWFAAMHGEHSENAEAAIAAALTTPNAHGRTPLMYAARIFDEAAGTNQAIYRMLPHVPSDAIAAKDQDGKTVLDMLLRRVLVCATNVHGSSSAPLLRVIHAVCRKGRVTMDFAHLPPEYLHATRFLTGTAPCECIGECKDTASADGLPGLAARRNWTELRRLLQEPLAADVINRTDAWTRGGYSVLHHVCKLGHCATLKQLLAQPHLDLDVRSEMDGRTALELATEANHVKIVRRLLAAGADPQVNEDLDEATLALLRVDANESQQLVYDRWELACYHRGFFLVNLPNVGAARKLLAMHQTPLHVAMRLERTATSLDELCDTSIDLDAQDLHGETALMVAAALGKRGHVQFLLTKDPNLDLQNTNGKTALMLAAEQGHVAVVNALLEQSAEITPRDKDGLSVLSLLERWLATQGHSPDDMSVPQAQCLALIQKELQVRENSPEYLAKQALGMVTMSVDHVFNHGGFAEAIATSVDLGVTFLNDCVTLRRHEAEFYHMEAVYGRTSKDSALHAVLHLDLSDADETFAARKTLLEHIVFRRLLEIKWELFGKRMYLQQLLMNLLLLITMTTASFLGSDEAPSTTACLFGLSASLFVGFGYWMLTRLEPEALWIDARYEYDHSYELDPSIVIPNLRARKQVTILISYLVPVVLTVVCSLFLVVFASYLHVTVWFPTFNVGMLWLTALYFVYTEWQEMNVGLLTYFRSHMNKAQLLVYVSILYLFVPIKLNWINAADEIEFGLSGFLTLALWVLSLQFLEVVPSASFLMPMMSDLFKDIWNFFILFSVFQVGFTLTFYQLFRGMDDSLHKFGSLGQSFMTTYYVSFGQLAIDSLDAFGASEEVDAPMMYVATALLMMLHVAIMVIILLNVLLAMMNKTVDGGLEKAKTQALISYAQCILRLETSMNLDADGTHDLIYLHTQPDDAGEEGTPLVAPREWLNPVFTERVSKVYLSLSELQATELQRVAADREAWTMLMARFDATIDKELDYLRDSFLHVQHFTSLAVLNVLAVDLKLIETARALLQAIVDSARQSRGQFRDKVLGKLEMQVGRELAKLQQQLLRLWKPKFDKEEMNARTECILIYQMAQRSTIEAQLKTTVEAIQSDMAHAVAPKHAAKASETAELQEEVAALKAQVQMLSEKMDAMLSLLTKGPSVGA